MVAAEGWEEEMERCLVDAGFQFGMLEKFCREMSRWRGELHNNVNVLSAAELYTKNG